MRCQAEIEGIDESWSKEGRPPSDLRIARQDFGEHDSDHHDYE